MMLKDIEQKAILAFFVALGAIFLRLADAFVTHIIVHFLRN